LYGLVNNTESGRQQRFRICAFSRSDRGSQPFNLSLQLVTVHLINQATPLILAIPFERGRMICHRISFKNKNNSRKRLKIRGQTGEFPISEQIIL